MSFALLRFVSQLPSSATRSVGSDRRQEVGGAVQLLLVQETCNRTDPPRVSLYLYKTPHHRALVSRCRDNITNIGVDTLRETIQLNTMRAGVARRLGPQFLFLPPKP